MPKILLVEDNEMNRDMLSRRLERKGYQITLARDGAEGLQMARPSAPDLTMAETKLEISAPAVKRRGKKRPLAKIRHDLRTPINHIIGFSEMLLEEAVDQVPEEFLKDLHKIRAGGARLLELINQHLSAD